VAALVVAAYHLQRFDLTIAPGGYLAVDFFFALSGVVIARAYDRRLSNGLSTVAFMVARFIRLYPMFAIGMGFMVLKLGAKLAFGDASALPLPNFMVSMLLNGLMLPSPFGGEDVFPFNPPAWSLFFELAVNLAFAAVLVRLSQAALFIWLIAAGLGLAGCVWIFGSLNLGWNNETFGGGVARVVFAFILGVIVERSGILNRATASRAFILPVIVLCVCFCVGVTGSLRALFDLGFALVVVPALLSWGGLAAAPQSARRACEVLGDLSYPLYAIHVPLIFFAEIAQAKAGLAGIALFFVAQCVLAYALGRYIDPPIRRWLTRCASPLLKDGGAART